MQRRFVLSLAMGGAAWAAQKGGADAEAKAIASIEKAGGLVMKLAQNDEHQEVNFRLAGAAIKDEQIAPVRDLKNLVHLNLATTSVTDAGLAAIKGQTKLTELHLEETKISDAGLVNLKDLKALEYLNLFGTRVSDAGLDQLKGLTNLKHLYVWQSKVTDAGAKKLKATLPGVDIVSGWDQTPEPKKAAEAKPAAETKK